MYPINNLLVLYPLDIPVGRGIYIVNAARIIEGLLQVKNTGCQNLFTEIVVPKEISSVQERNNELRSLFIFHPSRAKSFFQCSFFASRASEE